MGLTNRGRRGRDYFPQDVRNHLRDDRDQKQLRLWSMVSAGGTAQATSEAQC